MKLSRLSAGLILAAFPLLSHAQTTFEKTWFFNSSHAIPAHTAGYLQSNQNSGHGGLVKTDEAGDFGWAKVYHLPGASGFCHLQDYSNNRYLVSGSFNSGPDASQALLLCIDQQGNLLWAGAHANTGSNRSHCSVPTADGGVISAGLADGMQLNGRGFLAKFTAAGACEWSTSYEWTGKDRLLSVTEIPGGGYMVCGIVNAEPSINLMGEPKGLLLLMRTDATGFPVWQKTIEVINHTGAATRGRLSELIIIGQQVYASGYVTDEFNTEGIIVKCGIDGLNLSMGTYSSNGFCSIAGFGSICNDGNGNPAVSGGGYSNGCNYFDLVKVQPNLDIIWSKRYQGLSACWNMSASRSVRLAPDHGYIISSGSLVKVDANGEINCASYTPLQRNPCTWNEPIHPVVSGPFQSQAIPVVTVIDTLLNAVINCPDTSYSDPPCNISFSASMNTTDICAGDCITPSVTITGNPAGPSFSWNFPGASLAQSNLQNPGPVCYVNPGQYNISLHASGDCADTMIMLGLTVTELAINLPNISACQGDTVLLDVGNFPGAAYVWSTGEQTQSIRVTQGGLYSVNVTYGPCTAGASSLVSMLSQPAGGLPEMITICYGQETLVSAGNGPGTYEWSTGESGPAITVKENGTYIVTITNSCGTITDSVQVEFSPDCGQGELFIPNSFTPEGDGNNDLFTAHGVHVSWFRMWIYDRWGELLFSSEDIGQGWDGTYLGKECKSDVYVYRINYRINNSEERSRIGSLTLFR